MTRFERRIAFALACLLSLGAGQLCRAAEPAPLDGTEPLTLTGDIPAQMRAGINRFVDRETARSVDEHAARWKRDFSSPEAYERSVTPNRDHLRKMIGAVDARLPVTELEFVGGTSTPSKLGETATHEVFAVRWPVLKGVHGEGLLLRPKGEATACVMAI